jgi:hypothetical protein
MIIASALEAQTRDTAENCMRVKQGRERRCKLPVDGALYTIGSAFLTAWAAYLTFRRAKRRLPDEFYRSIYVDALLCVYLPVMLLFVTKRLLENSGCRLLPSHFSKFLPTQMSGTRHHATFPNRILLHKHMTFHTKKFSAEKLSLGRETLIITSIPHVLDDWLTRKAKLAGWDCFKGEAEKTKSFKLDPPVT